MISKNFLLKKQKKLFAQLNSIGPFVEGSLNTVYRICGNNSCKCMKKGEKHPALFLTWKENKITKTLYIPVSMYDDVKLWNNNYKKIKNIIKDISNIQKDLLKLR
jgi:hypothetical protein